MNLQQTINNITGLTVSEEDAMCYARDNFTNLVSHLRSDLWETMREQESRIKELEEQINKTAFDLQCQATENQQYREVLEYTLKNNAQRDWSLAFKIREVLSLNRAEIKLTTGEE